MRRPSSIEPFTPSPTVTLHPTLQAVLDNLDVQIEEELVRYRRQRRNPNIAAQKPSQLSQSLKSNSSDPTAIGILKSNIQLPSPRSSLYDSQPQPSQPQPSWSQPSQPHLNQSQSSQRSPQAYSYQAHDAQSYDAQREPQVGQLRAPAAPTVAPASTIRQPIPSVALQTPSVPAVNPAFAETVEPAEITSYAEQNDLSAYTPNATLQKLMQQPTQPPEAPEDYLESSEELLRSILEEDPELRAEREPNSMLDTLLTPLGIGSMLLLLLSSTTLGYVIMNPSSLGFWTANSQSQNSSQNPAAPQPSTQTSEAPSPNLASEEFVDLDLDTLSTLPKKAGQPAAKTPAAKPSPTSSTTKTNSTSRSAPATAPVEMPPAPQPQPNLSTVVIPAAPPVMSAPEPARSIEPAAPPQAAAPVLPEPINEAPLPAVTPQSEPAPAPTVAAASESTPRNNYYYVVTEYSGDSSLQEARGAVPDAYVRNLPDEGAKVQLGAFSEEAKAQELLQELQQQGIEAEVYTP